MSIICGATSADLSVAVSSSGPPDSWQQCHSQVQVRTVPHNLLMRGEMQFFGQFTMLAAWQLYVDADHCQVEPGMTWCVYSPWSPGSCPVSPRGSYCYRSGWTLPGQVQVRGTLILICTHFVTHHIRGLNMIHIQPYSQTLLSELLNTFRKKTFIL